MHIKCCKSPPQATAWPRRDGEDEDVSPATVSTSPLLSRDTKHVRTYSPIKENPVASEGTGGCEAFLNLFRQLLTTMNITERAYTFAKHWLYLTSRALDMKLFSMSHTFLPWL